MRREAGEPAPQRLHFRRSVEPEEPAERGRVSFEVRAETREATEPSDHLPVNKPKTRKRFGSCRIQYQAVSLKRVAAIEPCRQLPPTEED